MMTCFLLTVEIVDRDTDEEAIRSEIYEEGTKIRLYEGKAGNG